MSDGVPLVTVLMTTYNGQTFIADAIDSVLAQTFTDFELLVVDDCSSDATPEILDHYRDSRLRVVRAPVNAGIVASRNVGFGLARGDYIAALDHDDLCLPTRLERQVDYLDSHPGIALVATEVLVISGKRPPRPDQSVWARRECTPGLMRWMMHVANDLVYSSIMFRAGTVRQMDAFMREASELADDYDFFLRILGGGDIALIEEPLVVYRSHDLNTSVVRGDSMFRAATWVMTEHLRDWFGDEAGRMAELSIRHLDSKRRVRDAATLRSLAVYLERLLTAFLRTHPQTAEDETLIRRHAAETWWRLVRSGVRSGHPWLAPFAYRHKPLSRPYRPAPLDMILSVLVGSARCGAVLRRRQ